MGNSAEKNQSVDPIGSLDSTKPTMLLNPGRDRSGTQSQIRGSSGIFRNHSQKDSYEKKIEQRLKLRVSKFYNYIHENPRTAAIHKNL